MRRLQAGTASFLRFALVGGLGFLADAGLLVAFHHGAGLGPLGARIISMGGAALLTWRLNRRLTFGASGTSQASEGLRYAAVAALNAALNYGLYAAALGLRPDLPPLVGLIGATAIAMAFSYVGYSRFVFSAEPRAILGSPRLHRR